MQQLAIVLLVKFLKFFLLFHGVAHERPDVRLLRLDLALQRARGVLLIDQSL